MLSRREVLVGGLAAGAAAFLGRNDVTHAAAPQPRTKVNFDVPSGATDCAVHVFGDPKRYPYWEGRTYTPEPATVADLRRMPPPEGEDPRIDLAEANAARLLADLATLKRAAEFLERDFSSVARWERAEWPFRRGVVVSLLDLYGEHDPRTRAHLVQLAEDAWRTDRWDDDYDEIVDSSFIDFPWLETRAEQIIADRLDEVVDGRLSPYELAAEVLDGLKQGTRL